MVSVCDTLSAISNDKSFVLFNTIALAYGNTDLPIIRLKLTRRQYYSRMCALINAGLVIRRSKYFLTSFGKVLYEAQILIGKAAQYSSKLKAIDSFETPEFPAAEFDRIIDTLICDSKLKEILIGRQRNDIPSKNTSDVELLSSPPTRRSTKQFNS